MTSRAHAIPTPTGLTTTPAHETPGDFGFVLRYGYGGFSRKNVLDTFAGTFTKDMIVDPSITTELRLSPEDLADIYRRMVEIDIWDYPAVFRPPGNGGVELAQTPWVHPAISGIARRIQEAASNARGLRVTRRRSLMLGPSLFALT